MTKMLDLLKKLRINEISHVDAATCYLYPDPQFNSAPISLADGPKFLLGILKWNYFSKTEFFPHIWSCGNFDL